MVVMDTRLWIFWRTSFMFPDALVTQATLILTTARQQRLKIAVAESCTGGLIAALLTEIAGSSEVFDRGFVTYSNQAKHEMLGVPEKLIATCGAVSSEVAAAMASGVLQHSAADLALSVTGIAGPGGGTAEKPVGLVYIGFHCKAGGASVEKCCFGGNRSEIRLQAVEKALAIMGGQLGHGA